MIKRHLISTEFDHQKSFPEKAFEFNLLNSRPDLFADASFNWEMWRNTEGIISYVSPSCERITGYPSEAFMLNPDLLLEIMHPHDRQTYVDHFKDLQSQDGSPSLFRIFHKNGELRWINHFCSPVYDEQGHFLGRRASNNDVTDQKSSEERHQYKAEEYRLLLEHSPDLIARFDKEFRHQYVNQIAARAGNLGAEEYIGKTILESGIAEESAKVWEERLNLVFSTGKMVEVEDEFTTPSGIQYFNTRFVPEFSDGHDVQSVLSIARNITEQKQTHKTLLIQSAALQASANAIVITNRDGMTEWVNPAWSRLTGYSFEEIYGKNPRFLNSGKQEKSFYTNLWNTILSGEVWRGELINKRKDGTLYMEEQTITPVLDEGGQITHYIAIKEDISQKKTMEENLRQSEKKLKSLFAAMNDIIIVYDADGRYLEVAPSSPNYLNTSWKKVLGKTVYDVMPFSAADFIHQKILECLVSGQVVNIEYLIGNNGSTNWFLSNAKRLSENTVLWVSREITSRKQNEIELQQRLNELEAANKISKKLRSLETMEDLSRILLEETLATVGSGDGAIWMYDDHQQVLHPITSKGWFNKLLPVDVGIDEGITGHVFKTGFPYISEDYKTDKILSQIQSSFIPEGYGGASIPIITNEKVIGVLTVSVPFSRKIRDADVKILNLLAEIAGNAIYRSELHQQTKLQINRLKSLHSIDQAIMTTSDPEHLYAILLEQVMASLEVDAADILLLNTITNRLEFKAGIGFHSNIIKDFSDCIGDGSSRRAFIEKRVVELDTVALISQEPCEKVKFHQKEGFISHYSIPIIVNDFPQGVLNVYLRKLTSITPDWTDHFTTLGAQVSIAIHKLNSEKEIQRSRHELEQAYVATLEGWSKALDLRDEETEGHTERVVALIDHFAKHMHLQENEIVQIHRGAILHDIGKMGVPDSILHKTAPLTSEDWDIIKKHPVYAYEMLLPITYLKPALDIPYCHHENWDGSGYPRGLNGEEIPFCARLFALVDVFDALTSNRVYRKAWSKENALMYIKEQSGIKFDPDLVPHFLEMLGYEK
jgi:PAS domain S-box-containing protein